MNVVLNAANFDCLHTVLSGDASHEWPESFTKRRRNERAAFLGAEYAVIIGANVRHADIQPSLWDSGNSLIDVETQR